MASIINSTTTAGVTVTGDNSGSLQLATNNGTTAVTIDTSQNVGIGTASPATKVEIQSGAETLRLSRSTSGSVYLGLAQGGTRKVYLESNNADLNLFAEAASSNLIFGTVSTERMRINSTGNVSIGTSSNIARLGVVFDGTADNGCILRTSTNASGAGFLYFQQDTNTCGSVVRVGTTSAVTYATTSDYRLKENVMPMTDGLNKVSRLKPVTYTWKQGGESAEGFIAHELAEVCPDAVVGTKDQVETYLDEDGNEQTRPKYQAIDTSFLVATLTAAIQELNAKVEAQAVRIAELEGAR